MRFENPQAFDGSSCFRDQTVPWLAPSGFTEQLVGSLLSFSLWPSKLHLSLSCSCCWGWTWIFPSPHHLLLCACSLDFPYCFIPFRWRAWSRFQPGTITASGLRECKEEVTKTYESWFWTFNGRCRSLLWPCGSCNWAVLLLSGGIWWIRLHPLLCLLCQSEFNQILSLLLPLLVLLLVAITLIPRGAHQRPLPQSTTPWLRRFLLALSFACGWQILCEVQQRRSLSEPRGLGRLGTGLGTLWKVESGSHAHRWLFNRPTAWIWLPHLLCQSKRLQVRGQGFQWGDYLSRFSLPNGGSHLLPRSRSAVSLSTVVMALEELVALESGLEEFYQLWRPLFEGDVSQETCIALVVMKRQGGVLVAAPLDFFSAEDKANMRMLGEASAVGPRRVLTVPAERETEAGGREQVEDLSVVVFDLDVSMVGHLTPMRAVSPEAQDFMMAFLEGDPSIVPESDGLVRFVREWVSIQTLLTAPKRCLCGLSGGWSLQAPRRHIAKTAAGWFRQFSHQSNLPFSFLKNTV